MNDVAVIQSKMLDKVERLTPAIFEQKKISKLIKDVSREVLAIVPDSSTAAGRKQIKSIAYNVARSKTTLDTIGKDHVAAIKAQTVTVDQCRKLWRDSMDELKSQVMQPVTAYEERETNRVNGINDNIAVIQAYAQPGNSQGQSYSSGQLEQRKQELAGIEVDSTYEEFEEKAHAQWGFAMRTLDTLIAGVKAEEQAQAVKAKADEEERLRLQAERDERIRKEAYDKAQREATAAADKERRETAAAAERERQQAAAKQAADQAAEQRRRHNEKAAKEAEAKETDRKARSKANQARVNQVTLKSLVATTGMDEAMAKKTVTAIARGLVENVTISYVTLS